VAVEFTVVRKWDLPPRARSADVQARRVSPTRTPISLGGYAPGLVITRGVVVGRVIEIKSHPNGDRIWLASVDIGSSEKLQIVFGGRPGVVREGSHVPVAPPGSRLPGRKKMRTCRFRGEKSQGMLCSLVELGWVATCPDEVALLSCALKPGDSLDADVLSPAARRMLVVNQPVPDEPIVWIEDVRDVDVDLPTRRALAAV
jgi:tRNA-binding EMAP/Myf-like protein